MRRQPLGNPGPLRQHTLGLLVIRFSALGRDSDRVHRPAIGQRPSPDVLTITLLRTIPSSGHPVPRWPARGTALLARLSIRPRAPRLAMDAATSSRPWSRGMPSGSFEGLQIILRLGPPSSVSSVPGCCLRGSHNAPRGEVALVVFFRPIRRPGRLMAMARRRSLDPFLVGRFVVACRIGQVVPWVARSRRSSTLPGFFPASRR